ncbi:MAG: RHS repeat protein [Verrucomicrobiales bacterium]|nr:RHS repeat protein [Verrucomicrobiales bacterium]
MEPIRPLRATLLAAILATSNLCGAQIPLEVVRRDVFGARIVEAQAVTDPAKGARFRLRFTGLPGADYEIFATSDLHDWEALGRATAAGDNAVFEEPLAADAPRFYRVVFNGTDDDVPPTWPADARLTAPVFDNAGLDIDLHFAEDDEGVVAYALYLDGQHRATLGPDELETFVGGLMANTVYEFDVVACDRGANCAQLPRTLTVRTRAPQEPFLNPARIGSVCLNSGEFVIQRTDLAIRGRELDFVFTRTYRSGLAPAGPLGPGWTANCFERLRERRNGDVVWIEGTGRSDTFIRQPTDDYRAPAGVFMDLRKGADGFRLIDAAGLVRHFDPTGRLRSVTTRNGNRLSFEYDAGQLVAVVDDLGRTNTLAYDAAGRLETITDFSGRTVRYVHDDAGNLVAARSPVIAGTPNGNDFPEGKTERYVYDRENPDPYLAHNLVGIVAPNEVANGSLTPREVIAYGQAGFEHGRVVSHTAGGVNATGIPAGGTTSFFVSTTRPHHDGLIVAAIMVTDARGNEVHYELDSTGHLTTQTVTLAQQADAVSSFVHDDEGRLVRVVRPEGNAVALDYDAEHPSRRSQGNLLSVTRTPGPRGAEQPERVTRFTYEPVYNQPRALTTPLGTTWANRFDFEESRDFAAIGARVGWTAGEAEARLTAVGLCAGEPPGDLNGDGETGQVAGNVIRRDAPVVRLDSQSNQARLTGSTTQEAVDWLRYNAFGQLVAWRDAEHNLHRLHYHPEADPNGDGVADNPAGDTGTGGYLASVTVDDAPDPARNSGANPPPASIATRFVRNARGALTAVINPRGIEHRRLLNALDQPVRTLRAASVGNGNPEPEPADGSAESYVTDFHYDANNNLVRREVEDRDNTSNTGGAIGTTLAYDILDQPLEVTDEIDAETTRIQRCFYDANGDSVLSPMDALNAVAREYEERGLPVAITLGATNPPPEALGVGDLTFNPRGGEPSRATFAWDGNGNRIAFTDAADTDGSAGNNGPSGGDRTLCFYDGYDRLVRLVDPAGNVTRLGYDANSNVVLAQRFGPNGGPTPETDDPSDNLLEETRWHYDARNRVTQIDRKLFANAQPEADIQEGADDLGKGNLVPDDGAVNTRFEYDALGRRTFLVQDDGDVYETRYDGAGRPVVVTDPLGNSVEYAHDDCGNVIETRATDVATDEGTGTEVVLTTFLYDALDRLIARVNNLGHTRRFRYDSRDNLLATSDGNGPVTGATINRRAFPDAATTVNAINDHGNVTSPQKSRGMSPGTLTS